MILPLFQMRVVIRCIRAFNFAMLQLRYALSSPRIHFIVHPHCLIVKTQDVF